MFGTRAFLPGMLARGKGHVVNIGSLAGRFATPGNAIYGATKHAVVAFSEALNYDTERRNVFVTSVNSGFVDTEGFPQGDLPGWAVLRMSTVTDGIVGRPGGHRAGVLDPPLGEPAAAVPRRDATVVPLGVRRVRRARHPIPRPMTSSVRFEPSWNPPEAAATSSRWTARMPRRSARST